MQLVCTVHAVLSIERELIYFVLRAGLHGDIHHSWGYCVCVCAECAAAFLSSPQHHNMGQSTTASVIALLSDSPLPSPALSRPHKLCVRIVAVTFYDDITTVSDICVMAVSRLRVENEAPGDTVSDVLWRDPHIQSKRRRGRESVTEQESMCANEWGRDNILPLYGVIGRYKAASLPAISLNHLVPPIK